MITLGMRLIALRIEKGLTQKKLAKFLNLSNGTISNYENDVHVPSPDILCTLANFYNVTTDYLLGRTDFRCSPELLNKVFACDYSVLNIMNILLELDSASRIAAVKYIIYLKHESNINK